MTGARRTVTTLTPRQQSTEDGKAVKGRVQMPVVLSYLKGEPIAFAEMSADEAVDLAVALLTAVRQAQRTGVVFR